MEVNDSQREQLVIQIARELFVKGGSDPVRMAALWDEDRVPRASKEHYLKSARIVTPVVVRFINDHVHADCYHW